MPIQRKMIDSNPQPGWAAECWWKDPQYVSDRFSPERITASIEVLKRHFDAEWWVGIREESYLNIVARRLSSKGLIPLHFMVGLGDTLRLLENAPGFRSKIADLKGQKSAAAFVEFEVASVFARARCSVSFPSEGGSRSWDITAACSDGEVAIECKRLESEQWEIWMDSLTARIIIAPHGGGSTERLGFQIDLDPHLSQLRLSDDATNAALQEEILGRVQTTIARSLAGTPKLPITIEIPGIGHARVVEDPVGTQSWITGCEISRAAKLRRIFSNGVMRGGEQLPSDTPGIVVVYSEDVPHPALTELLFAALARAAPEKMNRMVAALLVPLTSVFGPKAEAVLALNRHSPFFHNDLDALNLLRASFDPIVV